MVVPVCLISSSLGSDRAGARHAHAFIFQRFSICPSMMGIWALVFGGMMPVGGIESGFLSHVVGVPWTITVGAVICAGAGLVTWWVVRRNPPAPE